MQRWIDDGILRPWDEQVVQGVLPLMAVEQATKQKVRPVLDYRELNEFIECHTGDDSIDVCDETLRNWRKHEGTLSVVDFKWAYLQIRVKESLWKHQLVNCNGVTYCLTRLGFGLNCAPRIMTGILRHVLSKDSRIESATSSYICLLYTSPSPRDKRQSRMPSSA